MEDVACPSKRQRAKLVEVVKKESKNVSEVWGHFTRLPSSNPPRAAYNYCGSSYAAHPIYNGTTALWAHLENSFEIFYNVTLKFSGSSYITSNAFFRELATLHVSLTTMMNKGDYHMASMAIRMRDKFNKHWGNIDNMNWFLFVAILLDPSLEHTSKDKDSIQDYIFMQLDGEDDPSELLESQFAKHLEEEECAESKSEVTRYLLDGCEKSISTIASESAFSTSGRVIDAFRSSLSSKMVEVLMCTQDWLRATPRINLCAIMEDIEKFEEFEQELEGSNSCATSKDMYD
ncbi:UNVERIFIED_CONTAM: putative AC transposase [Sesamum latifolium]|uniref:AC transposase n=1 Tax=Sesamum latifolium TaxID=2727402 RepID=A0AAW2X5P6_9LAMI